MRFSINLATRNYVDKRLLNRVCYGSIAILILSLAWNITRASSNLGEQRRLDTEIQSLESRFSSKPGGVSDSEFAQQQAHIRFYNGIIDRKGKDWLRLLDLIEGVTPEGVSLAAIAQEKKKDELVLDGRARSFGSVRQYLEKLEESKVFTDVILLSHQELITGDKGRGVQFKISCKVRY